MSQNLFRYVLITNFTLFLSGCIMQTEQQSASIEEMHSVPVEEVKPGAAAGQTQPEQPLLTTVSSVPIILLQPLLEPPIEHEEQPAQTMPNKRYYNWNSAIQPMVNKLLQAPDVNFSYILLVDNVNNHTNGALNAGDATAILRKALENNGRFTLVSAKQLAIAKQQLGLSPRDSLGSRSKAIGIARNVGAQYVLYSSAAGNVNALALQMQLMLVQTGEIVWSGKGAVQQQYP